MDEQSAVIAFLIAFGTTAVLTPVAARFARRIGAIDAPKARGLGEPSTPLLGGLAMLAGLLVAYFVAFNGSDTVSERTQGIMIGAVVIALVGAIDDRFDLHPALKLIGQIGAASIPVAAGVEVQNITLPLVGPVDFGDAGGPITVLGLTLIINVVNLSDGVDGLAAGVCAIAAITFAIIAYDLQRDHAGVIAAMTAGIALGFLIYNFPPADVYMGDCGSNLLGLLLGCVAVEGAVKTQAVLALLFPLVVLAVPFLDTTFVVLKRMKYRRPIYRGDANHFHHRLNRIGFSRQRTLAYLYAWTILLGAFAVALRFVPYSDDGGRIHPAWAVVIGLCGVVVIAASVYLVYVLELLKLRGLEGKAIRRVRPNASDEEIEEDVARTIETGEFDRIPR